MCRWWNDGAVMAHAGFPQRLGTTVEEVAAQLKADASSHRLLLLEDGCPVGEAVWRLAEEKGAAEIGIKPCVPSAAAAAVVRSICTGRCVICSGREALRSLR